MNTGTFLSSINNVDYDSFKNEFIKQNLSENEKQNLLVAILENGYNHKQFSFYKRVFDLVIAGRLNLNFTVPDHFATHFLSLVILCAPNTELFDYFITNGSKINFYKKQDEDEEFETCLDFAEKHLSDSLSDNMQIYYYKNWNNYSTIDNDKVSIDKKDFQQLIDQSAHLFGIKNTYTLINHIIATGGKRYSELNK